MTPPAVLPQPASADARSRLLPQSGNLPAGEWNNRHGFLTIILALHLPLLIVFAIATDHDPQTAIRDTFPVLAALVLALPTRIGRRARALATTLGLVTCSAVIASLGAGLPGAQYHVFVAVGLIALYEDWSVYVLAVGFVLTQQALFGATDQVSSWETAGASAGFVLALAVTQLVFWRSSERLREAERHATRLLVDGDTSVLARQDQVTQVRADLLGVASHEFRTPLTVVKGAAMTLRRSGSKLSDEQRDSLLTAVVDNADRLSRLVENTLAAAEATPVPGPHSASVAAAVAEAIAGFPDPGSVRADLRLNADALAAAAPDAVRQIAGNLLHNAVTHGAAGRAITVTASASGGWVTLEVVNTARRSVPEWLPERAFEAFVQADGTSTRDREGAGLGLFTVSRLARAYGGAARMTVSDGDSANEERKVTVTVLLPRAVSVPST